MSPEELVSFKNLYLLTDWGRLDVLGSLPPFEAETERIIQTSQHMDVGGIEVRVLPLEVLIGVKAAMTRPKDKLVEKELRSIAEVLRSRTP